MANKHTYIVKYIHKSNVYIPYRICKMLIILQSKRDPTKRMILFI